MPAQCDMCVTSLPNQRRCRGQIQPGAFIVDARDPLKKALCCGTHRRMLCQGCAITDRFGRQWHAVVGTTQYRAQLAVPETHTFTGPDGEEVRVDPLRIIHVTDQIKYTTVIVTEGTETRRLAVVEALNDVRRVQIAAGNVNAKKRKEYV